MIKNGELIVSDIHSMQQMIVNDSDIFIVIYPAISWCIRPTIILLAHGGSLHYVTRKKWQFFQ